MPVRHSLKARSIVAATLALGLLPLLSTSPVEAVCTAPVPAEPTGCCPPAAPSGCQPCPGESRSSCPAPVRARTCCSHGVLPPGPSESTAREAREETSPSSERKEAASTTARSASIARRAAVQGTSPPLHVLACTFRN